MIYYIFPGLGLYFTDLAPHNIPTDIGPTVDDLCDLDRGLSDVRKPNPFFGYESQVIIADAMTTLSLGVGRGSRFRASSNCYMASLVLCRCKFFASSGRLKVLPLDVLRRTIKTIQSSADTFRSCFCVFPLAR